MGITRIIGSEGRMDMVRMVESGSGCGQDFRPGGGWEGLASQEQETGGKKEEWPGSFPTDLSQPSSVNLLKSRKK